MCGMCRPPHSPIPPIHPKPIPQPSLHPLPHVVPHIAPHAVPHPTPHPTLHPLPHAVPHPTAIHPSPADASSDLPASEVAILKEFYTYLGGDNWKSKKNWITTSNPCQWHGVVCEMVVEKGKRNAEKPKKLHVTEIDLPKNNLIGNIPPSISFVSFDFFFIWNLFWNFFISFFLFSPTSLLLACSLTLSHTRIYVYVS